MRKYEASAKTVEEAIEQGLKELGVSIGDVDVQVLEEGSKGLFGLFGSRLARVCLTIREEEEDPLETLIAEETKANPAQAQAPKAPKAPKAKKPAPEKKERKEEKEENAAEKSEPAADKKDTEEAPRPAPVKRTAPKKAEKKPAKEKEAAPEATESEEEKEEFRPMEKPEIIPVSGEEADPESPVGQAYAFLKEITKLMGVDVTIDMGTDAEGNVYASMTGDTLGILIGRRGETLDALQYLTSLKVNRGREGYTRVTLDTENYRARREDTLIRLANRMANRATRTGRRVSLEPMNPYERRIIHYALQKNEGVSTHSEGDEPNRHVVITVKK